MAIRAVMFDLDGTLADTLADIAACGNHMLARMGRQALAVERYRTLAGQGARHLVREALQLPDDDPRVVEGLGCFRAYQDAHGMDRSRPYEGVPALLDALTARGLKLAVLSNKPDPATQAMIGRRFARWSFDAVRGHVDGSPLKPDPTCALQLARELEVPVGQWLYLGDTDVDMRTAAAAGMIGVGVLWGFRDEAELRRAGARHIVSRPDEVLRLLQ